MQKFACFQNTNVVIMTVMVFKLRGVLIMVTFVKTRFYVSISCTYKCCSMCYIMTVFSHTIESIHA